MFNISDLLNRLDHLETKNEQHEVKVACLEAKVEEFATKVVEHELKIKSQQLEIDQLKKNNSDLEEKTHQLILSGAKEDDVISFDFLLRSCFELKATHPNAQSGVYSIDPDGQIGGDPSIQVYCDMATRNTSIYYV